MPIPFIIVAIDGGAAAGKSSTSRGLSERYNLMHVDTGSFYRATTLKLLEASVEPESNDAMNLGLSRLNLDTVIQERRAVMSIDGWLPDESIRSQRVNENVSAFAAVPELRAYLLDYQRNLANVAQENGFNGLVMEGRDITTVIFPDADVRLFLYADPEKRAARRAKEGIIDNIAARDKSDSSRKAAPLKRPEGATLIDSSEMTLEEVINHAGQILEAAYLAKKKK